MWTFTVHVMIVFTRKVSPCIGIIDIDNFIVFLGFRSSRSTYIKKNKNTNGHKNLGIIDKQLRFFAKFSKMIVLDVLIDILLAVSVRRFRKSVPKKKKNQRQIFFLSKTSQKWILTKKNFFLYKKV